MKRIFTYILLLLSTSSFAQIRITEWMYSGGNGEFIEFTNVGSTPVNMTGWSQDDNNRTPGVHNLSAFGTVQPGESVILTETASGTFRSAWGLCAGIKIIGGYTNDNLGRSDEINLYDASNNLVDRLTYNDQGSGNVKGPRTDAKSAWVPAAALGANNASLWTLSTVGGSEGGFTSAAGDIGSPGKSTRAIVSFDPCVVANNAPTISIDVITTSNFLDGGVATSPLSPYGVSGTLDDSTDPAKNSGIHFSINDTDTPIASLTVTATSSNTSVVPLANLNLTGSGASRNLKITPAAVGFSILTITVSDGSNSTGYVLNYGASAASATPANTIWPTGISDASAAIAIDTDYYIAADDEINTLNVYSRSASGLPLKTYSYTSHLNLPEPSKPEVDLEASARSTSDASKIYWLGSMSNGKSPFDNKPNRNRLFATTISGSGASTTFTFSGYYGNLRASLIGWGDTHGYNFTASAAAGVDSKAINGFAAEGMIFGPDNTTLYIGLRSPLVPTANRTKAVIAPILHFETWFNNGSPSGDPVFGAPIELNLGNRGIRDLIKLSNGTYVIIAGNYAGDPLLGAVYKWTGNINDVPVLVNDGSVASLNMEGALEVSTGGGQPSELQVVSDLGDNVLYNDGTVAKDFSDLNLRKFRLDHLTGLDLLICTTPPTASITPSGPTTFCPGDSITLAATAGMDTYLWSTGETSATITVTAFGNYTVKVTYQGCSATSEAITLNKKIILADVNGDGTVSASDLNELLLLFGNTCTCTSDINNDGKVSAVDLNTLLLKFGTLCQ